MPTFIARSGSINSLKVTGSLSVSGSVFLESLDNTGQNKLITYNSSTGQLHQAASESINVKNAETASYSATLGASLVQYSGPDYVELVNTNGDILSSVQVSFVLNAGSTNGLNYQFYNTNTTFYPVFTPTGSNNGALPLVDPDFSYNTSTKVLNTTSSYALTASYALNLTSSINPPAGGAEGQIQLGKIGSSYFIFAYVGGAWRSASLA